MIRILSSLALAAISVSAPTAVAASAASAAQFHSEKAPTITTGVNEGNHEFKAGETAVICEEARFTGTQALETESSATVHPEYGSCEFLEAAVEVVTTGCNYVLSANGPVNISCSGTNKIKVLFPCICTLSFGTQLTNGGATYTNKGTGSSRDITVNTDMEATFSKSGSFCFLIPDNVRTFTGAVTTTGYEDLEGAEGEQVAHLARIGAPQRFGGTKRYLDAYAIVLIPSCLRDETLPRKAAGVGGRYGQGEGCRDGRAGGPRARAGACRSGFGCRRRSVPARGSGRRVRKLLRSSDRHG